MFERLDRRHIYGTAFAGIVAGAVYLIFFARGSEIAIWDFILDDAFITFRYAENWVEGLGPVWMEGRDPVEGYTSFAWVLVSAGSLALGISPWVGTKILSLFCVATLVAGFAFVGADRLRFHRLVAAAAVGLSPAYLMISLQGMETGLTALLTTGAALAFYRSVQSPDTRALAAFFGLAFLSILARPDAAPFAIILSLALVGRYLLEHPWRVVSTALACAIIPGLVYFFWRWNYYGYPLPNTAYVKSGKGLLQPDAVDRVRDFVLYVAGPYIAATIGAVTYYGDELSDDKRFALGWVGAATGVAVASGIFFEPLQGYLWRFQMPYYPVLLVLFVWTFDDVELPTIEGTALRAAAWVGGIALLLFPLWTLGKTDRNIRNRWHYDRVRAGKALAGVSGDPGTMLTSESGALPYFSGWRSVDVLGLTSERIAHNGLTVEFLQELDPSLVVFIERLEKPLGYDHRNRAPLYDYLLEEGYELRTVTAKTNPLVKRPDPMIGAHFFFVDPEHPRSGAITDALRSMTDVKRVPPDLYRNVLEAAKLESVITRTDYGFRPILSN